MYNLRSLHSSLLTLPNILSSSSSSSSPACEQSALHHWPRHAGPPDHWLSQRKSQPLQGANLEVPGPVGRAGQDLGGSGFGRSSLEEDKVNFCRPEEFSWLHAPFSITSPLSRPFSLPLMSLLYIILLCSCARSLNLHLQGGPTGFNNGNWKIEYLVFHVLFSSYKIYIII